jgi:hypothetical protein
MNPAIELSRPAFASAARPNAERVANALDDVAKPNVLITDEPW